MASINEKVAASIVSLSNPISDKLKELLAQELHLLEEEIDDHTLFVDLGLDSISGVTWIRKINEFYATDIEATKVYSYPNLVQLSNYISQHVAEQAPQPLNLDDETPRQSIAAPPVAKRKAQQANTFKTLSSLRQRASRAKVQSLNNINPVQAIAIVGMAGQFPQANNVDTFLGQFGRR